MDRINLMLTDAQYKELEPMFDAVYKAFDDGKPCGIVAQVWGNREERKACLQIRLIDTDTMEKLQGVMGTEAGRMPVGGKNELIAIQAVEP